MLKLTNIIILLFSILFCYGQADKDWEKKLKKAEDLFSEYEYGKISISVVVIKEEVVFTKKYGGVSIDYDQLYSLGKLSKYFIAISILKLVEDGEINLSDKLSDFFPGLPDFADSVNVEQLLIHKSGLTFLSKEINFLNKSEIDEYLETISLNEDFKNKTIFNDLDYYLLSRIIDKKYKKGYAKFIKKKILKPIGIKNIKIIDHGFNNFNTLPTGFVLRDSILQDIKPSYNRILPGASGMFLSINDLSKFIIHLNKGEIISKETFNNIYSVAYLNDTDNNLRGMYGLNGIKESVYHTNYFFDGGFSDFGTQSAIRIPVVNVNVILLTNQPGIFGLRKKTILLSNIFSGKFLYPGK